MILSPAILALLTVCALIAVYAGYAAAAGMLILLRWNPEDSSEAQLNRERKTWLLSSILGVLLAVEILVFVSFVAIADQLHPLFTGAMCATGTLNAEAHGMPAVLVMLAGTALCTLWLVVNHLEGRSPCLFLLRFKYGALVPIALVLGLQSFLVTRYFAGLDPDLITSCCGTFFDEKGTGVGAELAHLPAWLLQPVFWLSLLLTLVVGGVAMGGRVYGGLYSILSALMLPLGLAALVSFLSVRIYELPNHHCPFCLLHPEYGFVGYVVYLALFQGTVLGLASGVVRWLGRGSSLRMIAASVSRRLIAWSLVGHAAFGFVSGWPYLVSEFTFTQS